MRKRDHLGTTFAHLAGILEQMASAHRGQGQSAYLKCRWHASHDLCILSTRVAKAVRTKNSRAEEEELKKAWHKSVS